MKLPRYPKYKDSGVEWLGEVPEHWEVISLKRLTEKIGSGVTPRGGSEVYTSEGVLFLRSQNIYDEGLHLDDAVFISTEIDAEMSNTRVLPGDILLNVTGASLGRTCMVPDDFESANVNQHVCIIRLHSEGFRTFVAYAMKSGTVKGQIELVQNGAAREGLNFEQIGSLWIVMPPTEEDSKGIVAFLNGEIGKIDALVEEQRRLIELLKEKRQAVISHAVTKGLNPDAPMKDSGIEWLGKVPEHWPVRKLSQLFKAGKGKNGQMLTKEYCGDHEGDYPVYSGQTENDGIMATLDSFEFDFGSSGVLFSTTVGAKAMHLKQLYGRFNLSQNCMIIWPTSMDCKLRFFYYHLQSLFQFQRAMIPDHMQASFRVEDLYGYPVAVPPVSEQDTIAGFLDRETNRIDELAASAAHAIDLLQERRTALISAAVTGKIDVRGLSGTEAA